MSTTDVTKQFTEYGLSFEEDAKCNKAFEAFDKDESGYIDANELGVVLKMMGQQQSDEAVYQMISQASLTQASTLSLDEFKLVIAQQKKFQDAS